MADNVAITAGSGTSIAADEVSDGTLGSVKVQYVKLMDGTIDGTNKAAVSANGLNVDVGALFTDDAAYTPGTSKTIVVGAQADETSTDSVDEGDAGALRMTLDRRLVVAPFGYPVRCQTDITRPSDTTAYAANDALSDSTSAPTSGGFTFTGAARKSGGAILITDMWVSSSNPTGGMQGEVWVFNTSVTNINDNAAFAISDAEIKTVVAKIPFVTVADTNNAGCHVQNLGIVAICSGSANLRYLFKVKAAYTPASAEVITVAIQGLQID